MRGFRGNRAAQTLLHQNGPQNPAYQRIQREQNRSQSHQQAPTLRIVPSLPDWLKTPETRATEQRSPLKAPLVQSRSPSVPDRHLRVVPPIAAQPKVTQPARTKTAKPAAKVKAKAAKAKAPLKAKATRAKAKPRVKTSGAAKRKAA